MGKLLTQDGVFSIGANVDIKGINKKTGEIVVHRKGHNRCLKTQLYGIAKFLNGEFNKSNPEKTYFDWIPRYFSVGSNMMGYDSGTTVTEKVNVNDTRLLSEIGPRLQLPETNIVINRSTQSYVQLVISTYVPEELYNNKIIREAGLFSKSTGNNCLFRIVFDDITKTEDIVLEVNWTISVISIESENQPYEEMNKEDLWASMELLLRRFGILVPDIDTFCTDLLGAIAEYSSITSTPSSIQTQTRIMNADYNAMSDWEVIGIPQEVIDKVDEINGEIIT